MVTVSEHYDLLIENDNDPIKDCKALKEYMDKWDGQVFVEQLSLSKDKDLLEIGCGTGRILQKIINKYNNYTGIDISKKTICKAQEHFKEKNVVFITGDFITYNFGNKYDVVFSTLTFMHIAEKEKVIKKIYSLLKNGGKFVLSIDKNQNKILDTGYSKIKIYPDKKEKVERYLNKTNFTNIICKEVEFAYIFSAVKL